MAAGLYVIPAGADAWASYIDQAIAALNDGWVLDQSGTDATGAFTTRATFATAATFTLVGDQTTTYVVGRRLRIVHAGGTTYCEVLTSAFGALTTVTITKITSGPTTMTTPITSVAFGLTLEGVAGNRAALTYASTSLGANVDTTTANQYTTALSKSLSVGVWQIVASVTVSAGGGAGFYQARIDDGTSIFASAAAETTGGNIDFFTLPVSAIVSSTATATYNLRFLTPSTAAGAGALAEVTGSVASTGVTYFTAVKIG